MGKHIHHHGTTELSPHVAKLKYPETPEKADTHCSHIKSTIENTPF